MALVKSRGIGTQGDAVRCVAAADHLAVAGTGAILHLVFPYTGLGLFRYGRWGCGNRI